MSKEELRDLENFIINNNDLNKLELYLAKFNFFEAAGITKQELKHSNFLSFILDPNGVSSTYPVKQFLKLVSKRSEASTISPVDIDFYSLSDIEIKREWKNIDLLLISESNKIVCAVENKVGSGEHSNQLKRYEDIVNDEYTDYQIIYAFLTPEGDDASSSSWASISYYDIESILTDLIEHYSDSIGNEICIAIEHYLTLIKRYVVSDSEVARLCRRIYSKHQKAIDLILEHKPDIQMYLNSVVEDLIKKHSDMFKQEHSTKAYIRFSLNEWNENSIFHSGSGEWVKSDNIMMFEFKNHVKGLFFSLVIGPGVPEVREQIHAIALANKSTFKGVYSPLSPVYNQVFSVPLIHKKDLEKEPDELKELVESRWDKIVMENVRKIQEVFNFDMITSPTS